MKMQERKRNILHNIEKCKNAKMHIPVADDTEECGNLFFVKR